MLTLCCAGEATQLSTPKGRQPFCLPPSLADRVDRSARPAGLEVCEWQAPAPVAETPKPNRSGTIGLTAHWKTMGYHLRRCSYCNHWRVFKRLDPSRPEPDKMTREELEENFKHAIAASLQKTDEPATEKVVVLPSVIAESTAGHEVQAGGQPTAITGSTEEKDDRICPRCRSTVYRRSRRRWYERLIKRQKMARCSKCHHRFPYPY